MSQLKRGLLGACAGVLSASLAGCSALTPGEFGSARAAPVFPARSSEAGPSAASASGVQQVRFSAPAAPVSEAGDQPLFPGAVLGIEDLVQQVQARNPSLAEMTAAWQAAAARYPQAIALEDPMFKASVGPGSIGSREVDFGYRVEVSQKLPYPGKRALRGERAQAEAAAAQTEIEDARLQLIDETKCAFYDYYLAERNLEVSQENLKLLREARQNAEVRVTNNQAPQQDVLQADVEIGRQQERQLQLRRMRQVAIARINTFLHLPPDMPLPAPPNRLPVGDGLPDVKQLRAAALNRPDLQALASRLAADEAALALAYKDYCPDFEVMAGYDAFWQETPLRPMVGVGINLPVQRNRRQAAVAEAHGRVSQRHAQIDRLTDQVNFQVQQAYEQVRESDQVVHLYEKTILPVAESNVKEALSAYTTGKIPFLSLIEAQRNLASLRDRYNEAQADYYRRLATLDRVTGGPVGGHRLH